MENFEFVSPTHFVLRRGAGKAGGRETGRARCAARAAALWGAERHRKRLIDRVKASLDAAADTPSWAACVRTPRSAWSEGRRAVQGTGHWTGFWPWAAARSSTRQRGTSFRRSARPTTCCRRSGAHHPQPAARASKNTVVSNNELGLKSGYPNNAQRPKLAFMNPDSTFTLSAYQTAAGLNRHVLSFETLFDDVGVGQRQPQPVAHDRQPRRQRVMAEPDNYDARANVMWAGMLCHQGLATRTWQRTGWSTSCRR